jgi:cation diffusion facilitator CzcD-associated flavoprotein CzcO
VPERVDVAIVGAGPYGLSVAAHLRQRRTRTFGDPMETWRTRMPDDMLLRSDWDETSFPAPGEPATIDRWVRETGEPREEPIPLAKFLRYAAWFRENFVGDVDAAMVSMVERSSKGAHGFRVTTDAGDEVDARAVVLAVGAVPYAYAPPPLADADGVRFATDLQDYEAYRSRSVVVVGGGQGGLESAALAARAGADVELVVRSKLRWFTDREPHRPRGPLERRLYRLAYPVVGYGPPPLNRLVLHPDLLARLPAVVRRRLTARVLRAGGSPWLRPAVDGVVRITEGCAVTGVEHRNGVTRLALSDGSVREADAVIVAAGFRFALDRLSFLSPEVRGGIELHEGWPLLDRWFRASDPNLLFVGFAAANRFGPLVRFIRGARFAAPRVGELLG